jgi:AhpD family alkylhydroperoxidase
MQARMNHPAFVVAGVMPALTEFGKATAAARKGAGLPYLTAALVQIRAAQINGCSYCVNLHAREARQAGDTEQRIYAISAWREAPYFTEAERAALALAEAMTRINDRSDAVSDAVWEEAARHYDEASLALLVLEIAMQNFWNRLNAAVRMPAEQSVAAAA